MQIKNPILCTDSYKFSHFNMLPAGTTEQSSYVESRGGFSKDTLFFGLQMFLKDFMSRPITIRDVKEAQKIVEAHGEPFNYDGFMQIVQKYSGYWPVEIQAVPEGTIINTKNVLVQIRNLDPDMPWVTSFLETALLRAVWYPITVATNSLLAKRVIWKNLLETSDNPVGSIAFRLLDFGARGVSSSESAMVGGLSHLVNFMGTDTVEALVAGSMFYDADIAGYSIPASEHSVLTSWGGEAGEIESMKNIAARFLAPGKMVACVSDSYDVRRACREYWGETLKDQILASGGTLVIRPDSGDPTRVPVECVQILWEKFGGTVNSKGYKVLNPAVRVIQGDGMTIDTIPVMYQNLKEDGFSGDNVAAGMGGGLLQKVDRDTLNFALKCSEIIVQGEARDVFKQPIDQPMKTSKSGRLALIKENGEFVTIRESELGDRKNELQIVWSIGELIVDQKFDEVRARANQEFMI